MTWEEKTTLPDKPQAVDTSTDGVLVGLVRDVMWYSNDYGTTWINREIPDDERTPRGPEVLEIDKNGKIYIADYDTYVSDDSGLTWNLLIALKDSRVAPRTIAARDSVILIAGSRTGPDHPGLIRSIDGGKNWTIHFEGKDVYNVAFFNNYDVLAAGTGALSYSPDLGKTWEERAITKYGALEISIDGSDNIFTLEWEGIRLSTNHGNSLINVNKDCNWITPSGPLVSGPSGYTYVFINGELYRAHLGM